jgi:hypothetical protein
LFCGAENGGSIPLRLRFETSQWPVFVIFRDKWHGFFRDIWRGQFQFVPQVCACLALFVGLLPLQNRVMRFPGF